MSVHASIEPLAWESAFFALRSGRLMFDDRAPPLLASACDAYQLLQAKVDARDLARCDALQALGFRLAEGEADFILPISSASASGGQRQAQAQDCLWLRALARDAFALSRFRAPWYRDGESARFYAEWVEKAVYGTFDHACLLALDNEGNPQGFVTLRRQVDGSARIGLLAVDGASFRGGVGRRLVTQAQAWCHAQRLSRLHVATQIGNLAAQRLYLGCGAQLTATAYWLYR
ncbi:dTDP-4-amino-4,6-dideoxy-D-galactose acyltransferase [Edwardsiella ictaluri]|uniref:dTDP-fucosamine acetyltransferase n=1 Tax=Edwardsiella ictaluri (strain 93-146) TaxID=634503 RepID=C5BBC1_EDWI9|nr:dTDP-4-amino-4,6-dideoxy-D-galactose acyltransferase [Edwardsiella ictaluri]ACR67356.1 TDP-D-fucosamine acetyltransferase, putative [Edwardsiella ictaluri 93-146]ARD39943.1 TDP-fucosamine acetyltransferase [Edwardsiella ictaluri]AVZ82134.1 dTDP-4-amino-4,6-dideoxy-D-galactose acyltransferase [Edwardsiella ictaluri]EKS7762694.1 dTDP-4-amino-4,6-dideoxy-D-galactose acyltransferase [Edwardsiella ictaluri]EKS7769605.1 dTDP-4-amino-4,6-dideoxy-D-galactose acyltransferase [Edwardsiella ictaluri]